MDDNKLPESLTFRVSPRTMRMLGRENISSPLVAVLELVKNSYDADAGKVTVRFTDASKKRGEIVIDDNGEGMDLQDLTEKWMVISTDNKLKARKTREKKRIKVGEKGIGRLAMDRLCDRAIVTTFKKDAEQALQLEIDWRKYEKEAGQLQEVSHPLKHVPKPEGKHSGTRIHLFGLRDVWNKEEYRKLYSELSLLVPPFDYTMADFVINFECNELPELSGPVSNPLAEVAEYKLESGIDADGLIHHRLTHRSGEVVEEPYSWGAAFSDVLPTAKPACGSLKFTLYFYLRESLSLGETSIKRAELVKFLDRFQGIRIYRDGFRVKPYGDPTTDEDWLGLYSRRVRSPGGVGSSGYRIAANQVVGSIFISYEDNPKLKDQTNREGLIDNLAFRDLQRFALQGIQFLELQRRDRHSRQKNQGLPPETVSVREVISESRKQLTEVVQELRATTKKIPQGSLFDSPEIENLRVLTERIEKVSSEKLRTGEEAVEDAETERQILMSLSTLGIAMATFGHETAQAVNNTRNRALRIGNTLNNEMTSDPVVDKMKADVVVLLKAVGRIESWGKFALDRISRDKRTSVLVNVNQVVEEIFEIFAPVFDRRKIAIDAKGLSHTVPAIRAFRIDIESVLINFVTNALEAMRFSRARQIRVRTQYNTSLGRIELYFADSGRGIDQSNMGKIFNPLFSTRVDKEKKPIGTGMGLAIVKNITQSYNGDVLVEGKCDLGGAEFYAYFSDKRNIMNKESEE
ncbi:MAG: GHKL domain-containing protein [Chloroflexales bacterium]|nr:GHKL domain-containing protein [Chloroflexales bacterium]